MNEYILYIYLCKYKYLYDGNQNGDANIFSKLKTKQTHSQKFH